MPDNVSTSGNEKGRACRKRLPAEENSRTLRVGLGQMLVVSGRKQDNLNRAQAMIRTAASRKCDVVVLTETLDIGWADSSATTQAEPLSGHFVQAIASVDAETLLVARLTLRDEVSSGTCGDAR